MTGLALMIWMGPLGPYLMPKLELSAPLSRNVPWNAILHQRSWDQVLTPITPNAATKGGVIAGEREGEQKEAGSAFLNHGLQKGVLGVAKLPQSSLDSY